MADDSMSELPSGFRNKQRNQAKLKNRESYMEAVSMGSLDGSIMERPATANSRMSDRHSDRHSVSSTEPVDI